MAKVIKTYVDPENGRNMATIDHGGGYTTDVPADEAGIPMSEFDDTTPTIDGSAPRSSALFPMPSPIPSPVPSPTGASGSWAAQALPTMTPSSTSPQILGKEGGELAVPPAAKTPIPAAPFQKIPMGEETITERIQLSAPIQKERELAQKAMDLANAKANLAIDKETKNVQDEAVARQALIEQQMKDDADRQAESERLKQAQMDKYQQAADKYADTKIDSKRYWNNASTSDKLLAGIGLFAGTIANVRGVTDRNYGAEYIDKVIERDLKEQEANLNTLGKNVDNQRTLYQDLRMQGLDQEAAAAKAKEMAYKSLDSKLTGMAAASKSEVAKANLSTAAAQFKAQSANEAMKYSTEATKTVTKALEVKPIPQLLDTTVNEFAAAETAIEDAQRLEDNFKNLMERRPKDVGGRWNATMDEVKDVLGIQGDLDKQTTWKEYENTLMKQRAKVFGASLTESERKSFQKAITSWHSKPEAIMKAVSDIRRNTEREYLKRREIFAKAKREVPESSLTFRVQQEKQADADAPFTKKATSFK